MQDFFNPNSNPLNYTTVHQNNLYFNVKNCQVKSFARKNTITANFFYLNEVELNRIDHIKDHGVILDNKILFNLQYNKVLFVVNRQAVSLRGTQKSSKIFVTKYAFRFERFLRSTRCSQPSILQIQTSLLNAMTISSRRSFLFAC